MFPRRSVQGRVVLVTGASTGIGNAVAARLAAGGASGDCGRDEERLRAAASRLPGDVWPVVCDLTDHRLRGELVDRVLDRHGRLDALVNHAGQGRVGLLTDLDAEAVHDVVDLNVVAVADLTRLVLPHLARGGGDVVMVSSLAGWVPVPPLSLYSAAKAAVDGLVHGLRREAPRGVRVHSVDPGPVRTEWLQDPVPGRRHGARPARGGVPRWRTARTGPVVHGRAAVVRAWSRRIRCCLPPR